MQIFVSAHNDAPLIRGPHLHPIIGGAVRRQSVPNGYLRDDVGENISALNANLCEMTVHYWIWKNASDASLGMCHYRRYFAPARERIMASGGDCDANLNAYIASGAAQDDLSTILDQHDLIVPTTHQLKYGSIKEHFLLRHRVADWVALKRALEAACPSETSDAMSYFSSAKEMRLFNMFVGKREVVNAYYSWVFPILFCFLDEWKETDDAYARRAAGFVAERLFNWWLFSRSPASYACEVSFTGGKLNQKKWGSLQNDRLIWPIIKAGAASALVAKKSYLSILDRA